MRKIIATGLWLFVLVLANGAAAEEELWVIGKGAENIIWSALGGEDSLDGGWKLETVSIQRTKAKACYHRETSKPFCIFVEHPAQAAKKARPAGSVALNLGDAALDNPRNELLEALTRRAKHSNWTTVWKQSRKKGDNGKTADPRLLQLLQIADYLHHQRKLEFLPFVLDMAAAIDADNPELQLRKIRLDVLEERYEDVRKWLGEHEARYPDMAGKFSEEKAKLFICEENLPKALETLGKIKREGKPTMEECSGVLDIARHVEEKLSPQTELEFLMKVLDFYEDCDDVWTAYAERMFAEGRAERFLEHIDEKLAEHPENTSWLHLKAKALMHLRRFREARRVLEALYDLKPDPKLVEAHSTLVERLSGDRYLYDHMLGRVKAQKDDLLGLHALVILDCHRGWYESCRSRVDMLHSKLPDDSLLYVYGALSRYELDDWEGIRQWLDEFANKGLGNRDLYYLKAMLWHRKELPKALRNLDKYLSYPVGPEDDIDKYAHALEIRERLVKGETIWEWLPHEEYPIDPVWIPRLIRYGVPVAVAVLLLAVLGIVSWRRKRKNG